MLSTALVHFSYLKMLEIEGYVMRGRRGGRFNTRMTEHKRNVETKEIKSQLIHHVCSDCNNCEPQ